MKYVSLVPVFQGIEINPHYYIKSMRITTCDIHCTTNTAFPLQDSGKFKSLLPAIHPSPNRNKKADQGNSMLSPAMKNEKAAALRKERELFYQRLLLEKESKELPYEQTMVASIVLELQHNVR
eukprot:gene19123-22515_t